MTDGRPNRYSAVSSERSQQPWRIEHAEHHHRVDRLPHQLLLFFDSCVSTTASMDLCESFDGTKRISIASQRSPFADSAASRLFHQITPSTKSPPEIVMFFALI